MWKLFTVLKTSGDCCGMCHQTYYEETIDESEDGSEDLPEVTFDNFLNHFSYRKNPCKKCLVQASCKTMCHALCKYNDYTFIKDKLKRNIKRRLLMNKPLDVLIIGFLLFWGLFFLAMAFYGWDNLNGSS